MRKSWIVTGALLAFAACTTLAQEPSAPPTRVNEAGLYACVAHPNILATWAAYCPVCQGVLAAVQPAATTIQVGDHRDREEQERRYREEQERRRDWDRRYGYRPYFYSRPWHGYGYPPRFYGRPPSGYQFYPNFGYYYNPGLGLYYYPNAGYFYSPWTGQYYSYSPGQGYFHFQFPTG